MFLVKIPDIFELKVPQSWSGEQHESGTLHAPSPGTQRIILAVPSVFKTGSALGFDFNARTELCFFVSLFYILKL